MFVLGSPNKLRILLGDLQKDSFEVLRLLLKDLILLENNRGNITVDRLLNTLDENLPSLKQELKNSRLRVESFKKILGYLDVDNLEKIVSDMEGE